MGKGRVFYRMKMLMGYTGIDVFAAQKKARSKAAYFALLDNFIMIVPEIIRELEDQVKNDENTELALGINNLMYELQKIGATSLIWEAEKVFNAVRKNESHEKCVDEIFILTARLKSLQEKLLEARSENLEVVMGQHMPSAPDIGIYELLTPSTKELEPEVTTGPIEQLMTLVENFEFDEALAALEEAISSSYGKEIDSALLSAYNHLLAFEYDAALNSLRKALWAIETDALPKAILAVDDVPDVLNTVKAVLGKRYNVYGVTNHQSAFKFLAGKRADMILLDIEMPEMNGFTMLNRIRGTEEHGQTPVLFLTGNVSVENIVRSHTLGANDFIRKPINADVLLTKVDQHMVY